MSIDATSKGKLETEQLMASMVLQSLRKEVIFWNLLEDLTQRVKVGHKTVRIPRSLGRAVADTPDDGSELADPNTEYANDVLVLDIHKTVYDYIYDIHELETLIELKSDFYFDAPAALADKIEDEIIAYMIAVGTTRPDATANPNKFQLQGGTNDELTVDEVSDLNRKMTEANIPKSNRYLVISPNLAHKLRIQDKISDASKFGNNDAVVEGMIGKLHGFTVIESNGLGSTQCLAFHKSAAVKALSRQVTRDEERQSSKKREFVSMDISYGRRALRNADLIWFGDENP